MSKKSYVTLIGLFIALTGFLSLFSLSGSVLAAGGVGDGGSGGGGGGGHQTREGWGWVTYSATGPGPSDGFRNGASWANAQTQCRNANAATIYAHIIYDSRDWGMIYDYKTAQDSPSPYAGKFATGIRVDQNRATTISTTTARNAFNNLPSYGVSTAGYTFGNNVGWFCYDISNPPPPPPPPPVRRDIQAHVFSVRTNNTGTYTNLPNMTVVTCGSNPTLTTDGIGYARMTVDDRTGYCLRVSGYVPSNPYETVNGPYTRPYGEAYGSCGPYYGAPYTTNCTIPSYECQVAGGAFGSCGSDRNSDGGFDLVYEITPAPIPSCSISASRNPINEGESTTISWSTSYGVNMTVTGDGNSWSGTSGSQTTSPSGPGTRTYTGTVSNSSGSANCSTTVTIIPIPTCTISVSPNNYVGGGGNTATITWNSYNASSMTVRRGGTTISNALNGSYTDNQQTPGGYTYSGEVSIVGAGSRVLTNSCSTSLTVYTPPGCTASPTFVIPGETVTYTHSGNAPNPPYTITWSSGTTGSTYSTSYGSAGTYTVTVTQGNVTNSCTAYVVNKPYSRVYAGDTLAGVGFGDAAGGCPAGAIQPSKRQLGFTYPVGGGTYSGGGNSHSNVAPGSIGEFISGTLEPAPPTPKIFALANQFGSFGGNMNTTHLGNACAIDYYSKLPAGAANVPSGSASVSSLGNGSHRHSGNFVLNGGNVGSGDHVTFYVDGNVFISGNINYAGSGGYSSDPKNIPSFKLVVRGNIYVEAGVSELNGIYIAQPNGGSGGSFYTCGFNRGGGNFTGPTVTSGTGGMGSPYISSEYMGACSSTQLTVYGAVVSRDIRLLRSRGTVGTSVEGYPSPGAAERFILTPDTWFNGDPSKSKPFQSYSALPPIL